MAEIRASGTESMYRIDDFLGVNESPDGDTGLRMGEAAAMRNFRITREGNLQLRPGSKTLVTLASGAPVRGLWSGTVAGKAVLLAACGGHVWKVDRAAGTAEDLGTLTDADTHFFPFGGKVYLLNGTEYKAYNGASLSDVAGYVPIVAVASPPAGGGTALQEVNKLTGSKWQWFSALSGSTVFQLMETGIGSVDEVRVNGAAVTSGFTANLTAGSVTFSTAPGAGTNNVKIRWTKGTGDRATILSQRFSESFNGYMDNRAFLYGDGSNKAYYSGIEYETGLPTAEYFPDLNVLDVGEANTPITSLVRHFDKLMAFKTDGTWLVSYGALTLEDGTVTAGFYTRAIERDIGNLPPGQVRLINNYPVSFHGNSAYRWGLAYSSGVQDERAAKRISDPVHETLGSMDLSAAVTFDDEYSRELWIVSGGTAAVWNYTGEADAGRSWKNNRWYIYRGIPARRFARDGGELLAGTEDGRILRVSRDYRNDDGAPIDAWWESGAMAFDREFMAKYLSSFYLALKPETGARITATFQTDRKSDFTEKLVPGNLASYTHMDYDHFSYSTNRKPKIRRIRMKAKKFVFLKLILKSNSASAAVTVMSCDLPVSYSGRAK